MRLRLASCAVLAAVAAAPLRAQREPESLVLALGLIQRGLYEDAAGYLRQFLEEHPRHARASEAHYRLGVCELERGARGTAIAEFRRALRDAALPFRAECRYRLATALQQDGEHDAARRAFEELLGEVGEDHYLVAAAQFGAGECLRDLGDDAAALERFIAAAAAARDDADGSGYGFSGLYQAGFVLLRTGQHATAEKTFAALAERYPRHAAIAELRFLEGEAAFRAGAFDRAERAWTVVLGSGGDYADDALHGLAWCRLESGDSAAALEQFRQLTQRHPQSPLVPRARLEIARLLHGQGEHASVLREVETLLRDGRLDAEGRATALELAGLAKLALGDAEQAKTAFEQALSTDGGAEPRILYNLAEAHAERGDWDAALAAYVRAASGEDRDLRGDALYGQCLALHELGRHEESLAIAESLLAELPDHRLAVLARFAVAENLFALERWAEALAAFDAVPKEHETAPRARFKAAWCAFLSGDAAVAAQRFEQVDGDERADAAQREEALSMAALAHHRAGRDAAALEAADRYLVRHPRGAFLARTERVAARVLEARGETARAAERLERAGSAAPEGSTAAEIALERADLLFQRGDFAGAATVYRELERDRGTVGARALEGLAWCAFELGDRKECLRRIAAALGHEAVGERVPGLLELEVNVHHAEEDWPAAEAAARRFLERFAEHPRAPDVCYALGVAQARRGDDRAALATLTELAEQGSGERPDLVLYELAWVLRRTGREADALRVFEKVARASEDPEIQGEARLHLGEAAVERGDRAAARETLGAVTGSHRGRALYHIGRSWAEDGDVERAVAAFDEVIARGAGEPLLDEARFAAGEVLHGAGEFERAAGYLRALLEEAPRHAQAQRARLYLGECAVALERSAEALGILRTYLGQGAEGDAQPIARARAQLALGKAHALREEHAPAEEAWTAVTRLSEGELAAEAQYRIGALRHARGDADGAVDAWVKLSILYAHEPWVPDGLLQLGALCAETGEPDKARKFWGELIERFGTSRQARTAAERLKRL